MSLTEQDSHLSSSAVAHPTQCHWGKKKKKSFEKLQGAKSDAAKVVEVKSETSQGGELFPRMGERHRAHLSSCSRE